MPNKVELIAVLIAVAALGGCKIKARALPEYQTGKENTEVEKRTGIITGEKGEWTIRR